MRTQTIGAKLNVSVIAVLSVVLLLGVSSLLVMNNLSGQLKQAVSGIGRQQVLAARLSSSVAQMVAVERGLAFAMVLQQRDRADSLRLEFQQTDRAAQDAVRQLQEASGSGSVRQQVEGIRQSLEEVRGLHGQILSLLEAMKMDEALSKLNDQLLPRLQKVNASAAQFVDERAAQLSLLESSALQQASLARWTNVVLLCLGLVVSGVVFLVVRRSSGSLREIAKEIAQSAAQVAVGSREISDSSQSLAEGASQQAASLEEVSASSQEMSTMTLRNADSSKRATALMQQVGGQIEEANRTLDEMLVSMRQISGSSEKIASIIKIIDEISFQTNILALNAAVEAARAGEAGMGFAVVADEVRNLAQRCAGAARDTSTLIEESIRTSTEGSKKLNRMEGAVQNITRGASEVGALVEEVNAACQEQARGSEHIATALNRIEQVTQQTATGANQSATISQTMLSEAESLDAVVNRLVALVGGGEDLHTRKSRPRVPAMAR